MKEKCNHITDAPLDNNIYSYSSLCAGVNVVVCVQTRTAVVSSAAVSLHRPQMRDHHPRESCRLVLHSSASWIGPF